MSPRGRKAQIVDTNVAVVANRLHGESRTCANECAQALYNLKKLGVVVLDSGDQILSEYRANCSITGQPGLGDSFIRWIHDNIGRADLVQRVDITVKDPPPPCFHEFPRHPELGDFDPSDQKFVAVANAHPARPSILQATDSKWLKWRDALAACHVNVEFLCPKEIEEVYRRKMK